MSGTWDDLIGKPYKLGATGPDEYDCFGLSMKVLERMGYPLDMSVAEKWIRRYRPGETNPNMFSEHECEIGEIPRQPGDILVCSNPETPQERATHVAVHIGRNLVIHSTREIGVHIVPVKKIEPYISEVITWV